MSRHQANNQKVLIFVSDGNPSKPTGNIAADTGFLSPTADAQNDANDNWNNPTNAYTGTDSGADANSVVGAGNSKHQFYNFNFPAIPSGSTISGIEADTDAWVTGNSGSSTSATITPASAGNYDQWTPHGTTASYDAVNDATPDGDSTYIDTSASLDTFNMSTLSLPTGATISSVVLNAITKATASGAPLQLVAENGTSSSKLYIGSTNTLSNTTSYATTSLTLATNPLNSNKAWAVADINNMNFGVRTTNGSAIPRVTQMSVVVNYTSTSQVAGDSGYRSTASAGAGSWTNPLNATSSNNVYATDKNNGDKQLYYNFGFTSTMIPSNSIITGIEIDIKADSSDSSCRIGTEISASNSNFTSSGNQTSLLTTSDKTYVVGGSTSLWGKSWSQSNFTNNTSSGFNVQLTNINCTSGSYPLRVDQVQARVYYTTPNTINSSATITPASAGNYDQWTPHGTTASYDAVNDATPDGDSTYIDTSASLDTFNMSTLSLPTGATISSVVLNAITKATASGAPLQLVAENGTSSSKLYIGSTNTLSNTTSYATTSLTLATNPLNSNKAWAVADINNMNFGVRTTNGSAIPRVTQMSVVVNYSVPSVCNLGMDLSYDGGTHWTPSTEKTNALTGSVATQQFGGSTDTWSRTWAVTDFSNANFRARVHATGGTSCQSTMTEHLDWLRLKVLYNQTAATAAALTAADNAKISGTDIFTIYYSSSPSTQDENYLAELANGTTTVPGHQPGAYNVPSGVTTGSVATLATATTTPSAWTHPEYAFTTGNSYSTDTVSGHQQGFAGFSFSAGNAVPPTASITGVEIDLQAKSPSSSGCSITAAISTDGGSTYTSSLSTSLTTTLAKTYTIGGSTSLWGRTWTSTDFGNLAIQLQDVRGTNCSKSVALSVNSVKAKVYYSVNLQNSAGQNFFIAPTAADIPSIFNFIGNQVCPAAHPVQVIPPTTATLLVITNVTNSNSGTKKPSDFTVNVTTPTQSTNSFSGSSSAISLTIDPGDYVVTENPISGYTEMLGAGCSSVAGASSTKITAGEIRTCIITNDDIPPPPPPPNLTITPVLGTWLETSTTP